jgi:hypothetical protein
VVTVTLTGTVASGIPSALSAEFPGGGSSFNAAKEALGVSAVTLTGVTTGWITSSNTWIKQANQALNLYDSVASDIQGLGTLAIYKEKAYAADPANQANSGGFDILLWNGATSKVITFSVGGTAANTGYTNTVIIDYSGVTIGNWASITNPAGALASLVWADLGLGAEGISGLPRDQPHELVNGSPSIFPNLKAATGNANADDSFVQYIKVPGIVLSTGFDKVTYFTDKGNGVYGAATDTSASWTDWVYSTTDTYLKVGTSIGDGTTWKGDSTTKLYKTTVVFSLNGTPVKIIKYQVDLSGVTLQ